MRAQGSVLSLRKGADHQLVVQPLVVTASTASTGNEIASPAASSWLLWNGEVFGGDTVVVPENMCDTTCVLAKLYECEAMCAACATSTSHDEGAAAAVDAFLRRVRNILEGIHGPFAFIYHAASLGVVVFGRDPVGRRSLLVHRSMSSEEERGKDSAQEGEQWIISSTAAPHVGREGLHSDSSSAAAAAPAALRPPPHPSNSSNSFGDANTGTEDGCWWEVPTGGFYAIGVGAHTAAEEGMFWHCPWEHCALYGTHPVLRGIAIDYQRKSNPSLLEALLNDVVKRVGYQLKLPASSGSGCSVKKSEDSSSDCAWSYLKALAHAVWVRVAAHTTGGVPTTTTNTTAPLGLLFSGGIDSTILAALAHYLLPVGVPIELINVAFGDFPEQTPDRIGCVLAMHELLALPPPPSAQTAGPVTQLPQEANGTSPQQREWRLVLVDASAEEALSAQSRVLELIYPRTSVMDLNIGTALWFASRGIGKVLVLRAANDDDAHQQPATFVTQNFTSNKHLRIARSSNSCDAAAAGAAAAATTTTTTMPRDSDEDDMQQQHQQEQTTPFNKFQALIDVLVMEGFDGNGSEGGRVLLSTLGKEYGETLTPAWRGLGYKKLGQYLNDAASAGMVFFGGGATCKYVSLKRADDIAMAKARVAAGRVASLFPFLVGDATTNSHHPTPLKTHDGGAGIPVHTPPCCVRDYHASSRVLLLGMGADESLGGYMRYRRTFERDGLPGLTSEMQRDFSRLWTRNLGRDDRVVADHGREGRFPFLAEEVFHALTLIVHPIRHAADAVVSPAMLGTDGATQHGCAAADLQLRLLSEVVDVSLPEGVGDKKLLRTCARMLGLRDVSKLQKRAIQFGTRIADRKLQGNAPLQQALVGRQATTAKRPREGNDDD
jgi:hypothetical protein